MPRKRKNPPNEGHTRPARSRRRADKQFDDKPSVSPESNNVEDTSAVPPSSLPEGQVSFFITKDQKAQLRKRGYSDEQIDEMKPTEAHRILGLL